VVVRDVGLDVCDAHPGDVEVQGLPRSLDAGFRVEFYIKLGIVLMGATIPFTLIAWAGPVAFCRPPSFRSSRSG